MKASQANSKFGAPVSNIARMGGVAFGAAGIIYAFLVRYGIRDLFDTRKLLRVGFFLLLIVASFLGGFRSILIQFALTFVIIFYLEGLFRSRLMPVFAITFVALGVLVIGFSERLPLNVQRTISFLPVQVDPLARSSAQESSKWRVQMWMDILPEVPKHLLLGKGLAFSGADLEALTTSKIGGRSSLSTEGAALAGDYHNGPLSLLVPFGIWGAIGFVWFIGASIRVLFQNYKFGHPVFKRLNTFLYGYFIAKTILFFCVFGSFYSDLPTFTGLIALSIAINGGVAKPVLVPRAQARAPIPLRIHPAAGPSAPFPTSNPRRFPLRHWGEGRVRWFLCLGNRRPLRHEHRFVKS